MVEDNKEFKVVDRRSSSGAKDEARPQRETAKAGAQSGEGFVMKDKDEPPAASPAEIDFSTLIFSFATGALINLGLAPDPVTKKTQKNLELAKQNIEILAMLERKTKGNLTEEEAKLLENLLAETRVRYVEASR